MNVTWNSITDCTVLLLKFLAGLNYESLFSIIELAGLFNRYNVLTQSLELKHPLPDFFETRSFSLEKRMISLNIYVEGVCQKVKRIGLLQMLFFVSTKCNERSDNIKDIEV